MIQGILFGATAVLTTALSFIFKGDRKKHFKTVMKIMVLFYVAWVFFRFFMSDAFIWVINGGFYSDIYYETTDMLQSILRWGHNLSYTVLAIAIFFDIRLLKNISIYFVLPFTILSAFYFNDFIGYFMAESGRNVIVASQTFREFYFSVELVLGMLIPLLFITVDKHWFNIKSKTEWIHFLTALPFIALILVPSYIPQSIFGYTNLEIKSFSISNLLWFAITFGEILVLYVIFRFKSYHYRNAICWFLALGLFMQFNGEYIMGFDIDKLPFQLCNLGAYFFIVALFIKNRKFFNFVFLANVTGTIIAMIGLDIGAGKGLAGFWSVHFIWEHMQVFVVPILCMLLRIFPRIEMNALKHLVVGFSIYFLFCWFAGTIINGYINDPVIGTVNYFYIFDIKKGTEYFPFITFVEKYTYVLFGKFTIYPVFQLMIFGGFLFACLLLFFGVKIFFKIVDDHMELRTARINLYEKIAGKKSNAPREFID